jgi:hypothetical protein
MTHIPERRKEKAKGEYGTALYALISISSALEVYLNRIVVMSGK